MQRGTGVIDGLSRGLVLNKILPVTAPKGKFTTIQVGDQQIIDPESYDRYDGHAEAIAELNTDKLVATFHNFRPLLEEAYAGLGYKEDDFDNALIRSLDKIIATPEVEGDIAVNKKEAIYLFADPELEGAGAAAETASANGPRQSCHCEATGPGATCRPAGSVALIIAVSLITPGADGPGPATSAASDINDLKRQVDGKPGLASVIVATLVIAGKIRVVQLKAQQIIKRPGCDQINLSVPRSALPSSAWKS